MAWQESAASKELAPIVDKLMEVAMRYHTVSKPTRHRLLHGFNRVVVHLSLNL